MPSALIPLVATLAAGTMLALVFWLASVYLAPSLFIWLWHGPRSPLTIIVFAVITPILVGVPFGYAFGLLSWRRPITVALLVALLAAGLNVAHVVWAGIDLSG